MRPPSIPTTIPVNADDNKQLAIMKMLYNSLIEYREPKTQRILIQLFMCLPSRKDFPGYYSIIERPIAMNKIRERIEQQIYADEKSCLEDFKLMFSNCKFFNEDDSQIYKDAVCLENILTKRREQLLDDYIRTSNSKQQSDASMNNRNGEATSKDNLSNNHNANNHVNNNTSSTPTTNSKSPPLSENLAKTDSTPTLANTHNNLNNTTANSNNIIKDNDHADHDSSTSTSLNNRNSINDHNNHTNEQQQNGNEDSNSGSLKINHNHHNEASMDSSSNLSADLLASTPVEKCSLNTRRGRNSDAPKRQLLTGYIIYASEIRKQVIDKNPNQNFGDISRLVGNEWKALPHDIRSKYDQRALIHNKRVREKAIRDAQNNDGTRLSNGLHTPKMTKRKLAKLAKEQMRQHHLSLAGHDDSTRSSGISQDHSSSPIVSQAPNSTFKPHHNQHSQPQSHLHAAPSKLTTAETSTQTTAIRFVEPPIKKRLVYSESFKKYIESLQVPNKEILAEEVAPDRPSELPAHWLGGGLGRHESPEAALWALRDFMLQDAATMRRSMEPYL